MNLVKVDPVGSQPFQASFRSSDDVGARCAFHRSGFIHGTAEFCGQDDALAVCAQDLPDHAFRATAIAVGVGGIQERYSELESLVYDFAGLLEIDAHSEIVAPETDDRDVRTRFTQPAEFHG